LEPTRLSSRERFGLATRPTHYSPALALALPRRANSFASELVGAVVSIPIHPGKMLVRGVVGRYTDAGGSAVREDRLTGMSLFIVLWLGCGVIGAVITSSKNRGAGVGLVLGLLLGIIGLIIAACLSRQSPPPPKGMLAVTCPRCNAVQNVPYGQPHYECWQCHINNPTPGVASRKVRCPGCDAKTMVLPTSTKMKCPNCRSKLTILPKASG
jgi:DNA-directed RNA polymerase subunit RPC12/RpoP